MKHLLYISIGPVQDFIAAARRTADLYAGSQILQGISKAVTQYLSQRGAGLIFPAHAEADGANKILTTVEGDPRGLTEAAKRAAGDKLRQLWEDTISKLPRAQQDQIHRERAREQLGHFLEFYAAWVPLNGDYPQARQQVERLLAGRKALREFAPTRQDDDGVPKSPLDPARATVFHLPENGQRKVVHQVPEIFVQDQKLRFNRTEFLDAISLLKRLHGAQELSGKIPQTKTLARMALDVTATNAENLQDDLDDTQEPLDQPYFAILWADGDRMGERISQLKRIEEHQKFSGDLSQFAKGVQPLLEQIVYNGKSPSSPHPYRFCIYSGGDDVLAFLPVNKAVDCAEALAKRFKREVGCTLSVGIAIVHYRQPLSMSLAVAHEAGKAAKNKSASKDRQGNRLAIALHTRGGVPVTVVRSWEEMSNPKLGWNGLIQAYQARKISRGLAYELDRLACEWHHTMSPKYLKAEAERILARKEVKWLDLPEFKKATDLKDFAEQLIVARFLAGVPGPKEDSRAGENS